MIKSITVKGFGGLPDGRVEFEPGVTLINGPNESGKTTLIDAIKSALYGDGGNSSAKFHERYRQWNSQGDFLVQVEIDTPDGLYVITRDFGHKKNSLVKPDGSEVTDKRKVAAIIEEKIGLPTEKSFTATACVPQQEVASVCEEPSLRAILDGKITGAGNEPSRILKSLDKGRTAILGKSGKTGELAELQRTSSEQKLELDEKRKRLALLVQRKLELAQVAETLAIKSEELEAAEVQLRGQTEYLTAVQALTTAEIAFEATQEDLEQFREAKRVSTESKAKMKELQRAASALEEEIAKAVQHETADQECRQLEKQKASLGKKLSKADELARKVTSQQKKIDGLDVITQPDFRRARKLAAEVSSLQAALEKMVLEVTVNPESGVGFEMKTDGVSVTGKRARAHTRATVTFPGTGTVLVENKTGEGKPIADQLAQKSKALEGILQRYGAECMDDLEQLHAHREAHCTERDRLEDRLDALLGDDDVPELEASLRELRVALDKAARLRDKTRGSALASPELTKKKSNLAKCLTQMKEMEKSANESAGALKILGSSEKPLRGAMEDAATNLVAARKAVADSEHYKCTQAQLAKLQVRIEKLRKGLDELEDKKRKLSYGVATETVNQEEVAEAEEGLAETNKTVERFKREHEILTIIMDGIEAARQKAISGLSGTIAKRIGDVLAKVTNGRYDRAEVDGNLEISIYSPAKGDYITVNGTSGALSTGALDQVYLAARIALLEALAGDVGTPFVLDDTFANFDPERQVQAFEVLDAIAQDRQVLYYTCHDCPDRFNRIEVGNQSTKAVCK